MSAVCRVMRRLMLESERWEFGEVQSRHVQVKPQIEERVSWRAERG